MPDLRHLDCRVDFSANTFKAVVNLCKDLGIRHPEELSFCKQLEQQYLKKNYSSFPKQTHIQNDHKNGRDHTSAAPDTNSFIPAHSTHLHGSNGSLDTPNGPFLCAPYPKNVHHPRPPQQPISSPIGVSVLSLLNGRSNSHKQIKSQYQMVFSFHHT